MNTAVVSGKKLLVELASPPKEYKGNEDVFTTMCVIWWALTVKIRTGETKEGSSTEHIPWK